MRNHDTLLEFYDTMEPFGQRDDMIELFRCVFKLNSMINCSRGISQSLSLLLGGEGECWVQ